MKTSAEQRVELDDVEVAVFYRDDGGIHVQIDTCREDNQRGPDGIISRLAYCEQRTETDIVAAIVLDLPGSS